MTAIEILEKSRIVLSGGWSQQAFGRNEDGEVVDVDEACRHCALGAMALVTRKSGLYWLTHSDNVEYPEEYLEARAALVSVMEKLIPDAIFPTLMQHQEPAARLYDWQARIIARYNDSVAVSKREVATAFSMAIAALKEEQENANG